MQFPGSVRFLLGCGLAGAALAGLTSCGNGDPSLVAKRIAHTDELIGGPAAKGKVNDLLLQNDQLRAIVAAPGQSWLGNTFGGSLVDIDRVRADRLEDRYGQGHDAFGETFPLVNLLVPDPAKPMRGLRAQDGEIKVETQIGGVEVLDDGSSGEQAVIRVSGSGAYLFQAIKYLNRDFLKALLKDLKIGGIPVPLNDIADTLHKGFSIHSLLNRLRIDFTFQTDYIVKPGEPWITIRTTVTAAPPSDEALRLCPAPEAPCTKTAEECPYGLAVQELQLPPAAGERYPTPILCPVCACATAESLVAMTEQRNIFGDILGDFDQWIQPGWQGGVVGGDFLFFGARSRIFIPGEGFDDQSRVFENMWQGVGTLASPFVYPWLVATGNHVSYGFTTVNPRTTPDSACPTQRMAIRSLKPGTDPAAAEAALVRVLDLGFDMTQAAASGLVRGMIVDRNPIFLPGTIPLGNQTAESYPGWKAGAVEAYRDQVIRSWQRAEGEDPAVAGVPALDAETAAQLLQDLNDFAALDIYPAASCRAAQLLIPIFSTSATAVMTHAYLRDPASADPGYAQQFTWERYLTVGDGDVASALEPIYFLRNEPVGRVRGVVVEDGSGRPVHHAQVFAIQDPLPEDPGRIATWAALRQKTHELLGHDGLISEMQTDVGLDRVHDGNFQGVLPPGHYYLVAKTEHRRVSRPVPVTITVEQTTIANLILEPAGHLSLVVLDEGGARLPAKAVLVEVEPTSGIELAWDGRGLVPLGDSRFDLGIRRSEFSIDGTLEFDVEPGDYNLYVSRGLEYSLFKRRIKLEPGRPFRLEALLRQEVSTTGWISGDFHLHTGTSVDSSLPKLERIKSGVAEGLEFMTSTDHDTVTDYSPDIKELGLESMLGAQIGVETTTLEFGHFSGYPLEYDHRDWSVHDPPPWYGLSTDQIFAEMRARTTDPANFVLQVNHPFDGFMGYFAQAGLQGYNLERSTPGMELCNPQSERISCDFNVVELMNEKRFELIRTPTVQEVVEHNQCYAEILRSHQPGKYVLPAGLTPDDPQVAEVVCGALQVDPAGCAMVQDQLKRPELTEEARTALIQQQDLCQWTAELRQGFAVCGTAGITAPTCHQHGTCNERETPILVCKRSAINALKQYSVRRMLNRDAQEQEAFRTLTLATDPGCSLETARKGCSPNVNSKGVFLPGCGGDSCGCEDCVCASHPECCKKADAPGGTGWTAVCAEACRNECSSCGIQPCTDRTQMLDTWFSFLNQGFVVTGVGNSDSHNRQKEIGLPRNFIRIGRDQVMGLTPAEVNRALLDHKVTATSGPFIELTISGGQIGDTVTLPADQPPRLQVKVQTPSWFSVEWLEIYRNGRLEKKIRLTQLPDAIVDFDETLELPRPAEDSWYVAVAYGLNRNAELSPPYNGLIYGQLLIPTILSLGIGQILGSFDALMARLEEIGYKPLLDMLTASLASSQEMPDSYPTLPFGVTNPIWVDIDGNGFVAPAARLQENGQVALPPFCSQSCSVALTTEGTLDRSSCGENQLCQPLDPAAATDGAAGICSIPIPAHCPADGLDQHSSALSLDAVNNGW